MAPHSLLAWASYAGPGDNPRFGLAAGARLGPDDSDFRDPEMSCWNSGQLVNTAGIYFSCCPLDGFFREWRLSPW